MPQLPEGALVVVPAKTGDGFYWEGKYRLSGRQRKVRLGRANLSPRQTPLRRSKGEEVEGWRLRYVSSKGRPTFAFLSPDEAKAKLRDVIAADVERAAQVAAGAKPEVLTLAAVADAWIKHRSTRGRGLRPSTERDYRWTAAQIVDHFGNVPVQEIETKDVIAWQDELRARTEPRPLSHRTINKFRMVLHGIFEHACRPIAQGGIGLASNPVKWAEPLAEDEPEARDPLTPAEVVDVARAVRAGLHRSVPKVAVGPRQKGRATVVREPSPTERRIMREQDERDATAVLVLAFCGVRSGELAALRWKHVDFAASRIRIERSYSATVRVETGTKGRETRWTVLPEQVAQPLARMSQRAHRIGLDDLVFCDEQGSYVDMSAFRRRFKRAVAAAGITRHVRVHDLRHGATTDMRSVFTADHVQKLVGHKDARTAQRYAHARSQADEAERWTAFLAGQIDADATA